MLSAQPCQACGCVSVSESSFLHRAFLGLRERQEITWTFECPIAPHLGSLLNREIRDVERLCLWFHSIGRDPIWGTLGPQIVQLIYCRSLIMAVCALLGLRIRGRRGFALVFCLFFCFSLFVFGCHNVTVAVAISVLIPIGAFIFP